MLTNGGWDTEKFVNDLVSRSAYTASRFYRHTNAEGAQLIGTELGFAPGMWLKDVAGRDINAHPDALLLEQAKDVKGQLTGGENFVYRDLKTNADGTITASNII